jgi:hypothetical protein
MTFGPLRHLVLDLNLAVHGVDAVVTRPAPYDTPILARCMWMTPLTEDFPATTDFSRREPRRIAVFGRDDLPRLPKGTLILAPEQAGGTPVRWRTDGTDRVEADKVHVFVVRDPEIAEE